MTPALTKRLLDAATPALVLWSWGEVVVAIEIRAERVKDRHGESWWRDAGSDETVERVLLATGTYVSTVSAGRPRRGTRDGQTGRLLLPVCSVGRLVDGALKWREATTPGGEAVALGDSTVPGACRMEHPFPHGTVAGAVPQYLLAAARFGDVLVPAGAGLWTCHVPGKIAAQLPDPPDLSDLLVTRELRLGGET